MKNEQARSLYILYKDGRDYCIKFKKIVDFLISDKSGIDQFLEGFLSNRYSGIESPLHKKVNIRDFKDEELEKAYKALVTYHDKWSKQVIDILDEIPQISFRMRFDEPNIERNTKTLIQADYDITEDMCIFLDAYDMLFAKVNELPSIINDFEKSIYHLSDLRQERNREKKNIVYRLRYDEMQGKLYLNDTEVYKSNLGSKLDRALSNAFSAPGTTIKTVGSIASALDSIKMPKSFKNLVFRASKGNFIVRADITDEDLKNAKLDKKTLDLEIQNFSK